MILVDAIRALLIVSLFLPVPGTRCLESSTVKAAQLLCFCAAELLCCSAAVLQAAPCAALEPYKTPLRAGPAITPARPAVVGSHHQFTLSTMIKVQFRVIFLQLRTCNLFSYRNTPAPNGAPMFICRHSDCFVCMRFPKKITDFGKKVPTNVTGASSGAGVLVQLKRLQVLAFLNQ